VKNYPVNFVDRNSIFSLDKSQKPLMLVVEIDEDGKLCLNKIQTGTIDDVTLLSRKLKVIFDDREKTSINEREVVIDPQGEIKSEVVEKLIENLADVKASPIRVIKNNL
jgi:biopolymer transport protein ExbD